MKVYLYPHDPDDDKKQKPQKLELGRIPVVGEYIATSNTVHWYQVVLVLHTSYIDADAEAEVWGVKTTRSAALKASGIR
jgi:hypothetical protein